MHARWLGHSGSYVHSGFGAAKSKKESHADDATTIHAIYYEHITGVAKIK